MRTEQTKKAKEVIVYDSLNYCVSKRGNQFFLWKKYKMGYSGTTLEYVKTSDDLRTFLLPEIIRNLNKKAM